MGAGVFDSFILFGKWPHESIKVYAIEVDASLIGFGKMLIAVRIQDSMRRRLYRKLWKTYNAVKMLLCYSARIYPSRRGGGGHFYAAVAFYAVAPC